MNLYFTMSETGTQVVLNYEQNKLAVAFQSLSIFIIISAALLGNVLVIHAIWQDLRKQTVGNILVFNVSVADLAMTAVMVVSLVALLNGSWSFGRPFCATDIFFSSTFTRVSLLTLVLITYDKYREICRHIYPNISKSYVYIIIGVMWMLSILSSSPYPSRIAVYRPAMYHCSYDKHVATDVVKAIEYATSVVEMASFLLIAFFLWRINRVVWRSKNLVKPVIISNERVMMTKSKKYSAYTTTITLGVYLALVLPHFVSATVMDLNIVRHISPGWQVVFYWIFCCHCALKPIIYAMRCERYVEFLRWHVSRLPCYQKFQPWKKRNRMEIYRVRKSSHEETRPRYLQAAETSTRRRPKDRETSCEFTDLAAFPYKFEEEKFNQDFYGQPERELSSRSNSYQLKTKNPPPRVLFVHGAESSTMREDDPLAEIEFSLTLDETDSEPSVSSDHMLYNPTKEVLTSIGACGDSERNENKQQRGQLNMQRTRHAVQVDIHSSPITHSSALRGRLRRQTELGGADCPDEHIELENMPDGYTIAGGLNARDEPDEVNYKAKNRLRIIPLQLMLPGLLLGDDQLETEV